MKINRKICEIRDSIKDDSFAVGFVLYKDANSISFIGIGVYGQYDGVVFVNKKKILRYKTKYIDFLNKTIDFSKINFNLLLNNIFDFFDCSITHDRVLFISYKTQKYIYEKIVKILSYDEIYVSFLEYNNKMVLKPKIKKIKISSIEYAMIDSEYTRVLEKAIEI